ncbi:MAG TPA: hypothetical protein VGL75_17550 [Acidothermaceae bacterium]
MSDDATPESADLPEPTLAYSQPRPMPYGSSPYAVSVPQGADAPSRGRSPIGLADVWTALLGTVAVVIVGVLAGFLWLWIAPRPHGVVSASGGKSIQFDSANKVFASADVTFLFIGVGAGLLCGLVATILARRRGVAVSIAMAVGGTLASLLAAFIGRALSGGPQDYWLARASVGPHRYFIELTTRRFLVGWPIAALLVVFVVALFTPDRPVEIEPTEPAPAESAPNTWPN